MLSLVEIGPVVLEKKIFKFHQCIFAISKLSLNYLLLDKGGALLWNKRASTSLKDAFGWNGLSCFGEEDFQISMYFHYFITIFPWKRAGPFIWSTWIPFTHGCFVPSLVEIGSVVLQKMKMWKVYKKTDRQTDRQTTRKAHVSFQLRWAKNLTGCFTGLHCL